MTTEALPTPRAASLPPSSVHAVFRSVNAWERRTGRKAARLDVGEPHFPPPGAAVEALAKAARDGHTGYTSAEGMSTLREALAAKLVENNAHDTGADRVYICAGAAQGLTALIQSLADPGDEILLPAFHWPIHLQQSLLTGMRPVSYPLDDQFRPDLDALRRLGGERTRILLVNSPSNPTGAVYDRQLLRELWELAEQRNWQIISDEAYEDFVFEGAHVSLGSLERDVPPAKRRVSTVFSFSKTYGMTGYRLGYVVTPDVARGATFQVVQEASILSSPTPVQHAGLAALESTAEVRSNRESVRAAREGLRALDREGLLAAFPAGGWFALLDISSLASDAETFAAAVLDEHAIALAPAHGFALRPTVRTDGSLGPMASDPRAAGHLRLAFCGQPATVHDAAKKVASFARTWSEREHVR
ncbi:pyridoxal phosphate-dependent aminotransferase [Saccharomonospora piscinae]|uniref:pyridoxal phosphate-dependent aminotransferase n=1 Tax=Saccharomonospora piscinae TaxID=687388 RepID=UPI00046753BF|nr:pyridoxal phosphate-dependent aminotransferase [Saccharomonospora piscinae]